MVTGEQPLDELLHQHNSIFQDNLGSVKDKLGGRKFKVHTHLLATHRVCNVLDKLQVKGAPVVLLAKHDDIIKLCGDYKLTINSIAKKEVPCMLLTQN